MSRASADNTGLCRLEAREARELVARRVLSAAELAEAVIARLEATEASVAAYTGLRLEQALEEAREIDRALDRGGEAGPLAGVPVAVKDNLCLAGLPLSCASRHLAGYEPPEDATVVRRLREGAPLNPLDPDTLYGGDARGYTDYPTLDAA